jgi:hypothetical protein
MSSLRIVSVATAALIAALHAERATAQGSGSATSGPTPPAAASSAPSPGSVCNDPANACPGFRRNDLSFVLAVDSVARADQRSEAFYAVVLKTGPACSIAERERSAAQAQFPTRKVFSGRFECDDVEAVISYTNVDSSLAFLAMYGGRTREEAAAALAEVTRKGGFPRASVRRMQVVYNYP